MLIVFYFCDIIILSVVVAQTILNCNYKFVLQIHIHSYFQYITNVLTYKQNIWTKKKNIFMLYKVRQYLRILNFVFNIFFFDASALIVKKNIYELFKQIYLRWYKKMQISRRLLIHEWWKIVENVFNLTAIAFPCNKIYEELVQHEMNTKWRWKIKVSIFLFSLIPF